MLLAIDIGNTNITLGVYADDELLGIFRMTTKTPRTSDEYGVLLLSLLSSRGIEPSRIDAVIISSVVPGIMHSFHNAIRKYLHVESINVGPGTKTGIRIRIPNPRELGADRIADAVAAYSLYGGPVLVIDFGTATTYDLITEDATFEAGITSPGIRISANALWNETAKLPEIEIRRPESILTKDTVSSMQAGLIYGAIGQTKYIIQRVKEESGIDPLFVVATGGLGKLISESIPEIDRYDPELTLKGLRIIYEKTAADSRRRRD